MRRNRETLYSERHAAQRSIHDADQTEYVAMIKGSAVFEQGIYDDRVAESLDDFEPEISDIPYWQGEDLKYDVAAGKILEQIDRRNEILGKNYPFIIDNNSLIYNESKTKLYEFCLAVCMAKSITKNPFTCLPRTFEQLSCALIRHYLGIYGNSFHTGWPRKNGKAKHFKKLIEQLRQEIQPVNNFGLKEWRWAPERELPDDPDPKYVKDEGIDFIAWKQHNDLRGGDLYLLGQCACGGDWIDKFHDIHINKLQKWFNPMCYIDPVKVFCTPFHINDSLIADASREAGLVFDRLRLVHIAEHAGIDALKSSVEEDLNSLINLVITS